MNKHFVFYTSSILLIIFTSCGAAKFGKDASISHQIGEYYKAIEKYRQANRKEKDRSKRMNYDYAIGECYKAIGEYEKAAIYYRNAIRRGYNSPSAILNLAEMQRYSQEYEKAIENYRNYLKTYPDNKKAITGLSSIKKTQEWLSTPTRHIISPVKELNSRESDFAPHFIRGQGNEIFFTSSRKSATGKKKNMITGQDFTDLFRSTYNIQRQKWEQPQLIDETLSINTGEEDGAATLSSNGKKMIFTRCRYDKTQPLGAELFTTSQSHGSWSEPIKLQIVADSIIAAHPSLNYNGNELYFVSDMAGGYGGKDIWKVKKNNGDYGAPINLGEEINTPGDEIFPFIRDNGELYFSSNYHIGMGGYDIFKASKDVNGNWIVKNMGYPINSPFDDFGIAFEEGQNRGMFSSNRKGSRGDDLYSFVVPPIIFKADGKIIDKESKRKIKGANIRIIGTDGTNLRLRAQNGKFQLSLKPETEYIFAAFKDGYLRDKISLNTIGLKDSKKFSFDLYLTPTDAPIKLDNINYEFGRWELLPESKITLDSLVAVLMINPTITIEIMSHTDYIGSEQFNFDLSQKRAESVVYYLIKKGINSQRLFAKGYGETWPKTVTEKIAKKYNFLKKGDELTEDFILKLIPEEQEKAKAINRRTEFRVLSNDFIENFD